MAGLNHCLMLSVQPDNREIEEYNSQEDNAQCQEQCRQAEFICNIGTNGRGYDVWHTGQWARAGKIFLPFRFVEQVIYEEAMCNPGYGPAYDSDNCPHGY